MRAFSTLCQVSSISHNARKSQDHIRKCHTPFGVIISSIMGSIGILHKLAVPNEGGYSRVLTTYNGQSKFSWKCQYYNPYWLSSDYNNGITQKLYFFDNYAFTYIFHNNSISTSFFKYYVCDISNSNMLKLSYI